MTNWFNFVVGVLFGWWFAPMLADMARRAWAEFINWYQHRRFK